MVVIDLVRIQLEQSESLEERGETGWIGILQFATQLKAVLLLNNA